MNICVHERYLSIGGCFVASNRLPWDMFRCVCYAAAYTVSNIIEIERVLSIIFTKNTY